MKTYPITTQVEIRQLFWETYPDFDYQARQAGIRSKSQNHQCATVRCTFVDFVGSLARNNQISEALAFRATL